MSLKFSQFSLVASPGGTISVVGYVGGTNVRMTLATFPISNATQAALNLLAPKESPTITGEPFFDLDAAGMGINANGNQIGFIDEAGWTMTRPLIENPTTITNGDSPNIAITDLFANGLRTDGTPLVLPAIGGARAGQHLVVAHAGTGPQPLNANAAGEIYDGSAGAVDSITLAVGEVAVLQAIDTSWRVLTRYRTVSPAAVSDMFSALTAAEIGITTTATATISRMHVCSGTTANYTVTLPAVSGNTGQFIGFRMAPGLTKLVTIEGASPDQIDGASSRVMWANESAILFCDGVTWTKVAGKTIPMYCRMRRVGALSIPNNTFTDVLLDTISTDNTGFMGDVTNNRINIVRPGTYDMFGALQMDGAGAPASLNTSAAIFVGGVAGTMVGSQGFPAAASTYPTPAAPARSTLDIGNSISLAAYQLTGGSQNLLVGAHPIPLDVIEFVSW